MTKNQFTRLVQRCDSNHFTSIALEKNGKIIPLRKMHISHDDKRIYFHAVDEKESCNIFKNNISDVAMLNKGLDGYHWSVKITTKSGEEVKVHMNMEAGFSPYAYTNDLIENYKAVAKALPKHLDKFKEKTLIVQHCTSTTIYKEADDDGGDVQPVTDNYIIHNFDYKIFYDDNAPNIPCVRMFSKDNSMIFACAMGVKLVSSPMLFTADGEYSLKVIA